MLGHKKLDPLKFRKRRRISWFFEAPSYHPDQR